MVKNSISVIIPSFHRYETVNEELKLFSQQTVLPNEILIIDQTPLEERKIFDIKKYPNLDIKLFFQDKPNACIARNFGAKKAKSKYLLIIDDDIIFKEDFIESHLIVMEDENVDVVNGGVTLKDKLPKKYPWNISDMDPVRFFLGAPNHEWEGMMLSVSSCNFSIKKRIYEAVNGFDPIAPRMHDFEFGFRLFKYGAKIYYSHKPWCKHLRASGGLRKNPKNHNKLVSALYIHNKHFPGWITTQFKLKYIFSVFNRGQFKKRPWRPFILPFKIYKLLKANKVANKLVKKSMEDIPIMTFLENEIFKSIFNNISDSSKVLAYDSSCSTVYYAEYLKKSNKTFELDIIEYDENRVEKIKSAIQSELGTTQIHLIDFKNKDPRKRNFDQNLRDQYISLSNNLKKDFDIIIVNGRFRNRCFKYAVENMKTDSIVILMDAERNYYTEGLNLKKSIFIDTGLSPFSYKPKTKKILIYSNSENKLKEIGSLVSEITSQKL